MFSTKYINLEELENNIKRIIETKENCKLSIYKSFNCIHFIDDKSETELRLLFLNNYRLTVSRVYFRNKRKGTMTEIIKLLNDFCIENKIEKIVIQSVLTKEMSNFCYKNNFKPNESAIMFDGFLSGCYEYKVKFIKPFIVLYDDENIYFTGKSEDAFKIPCFDSKIKEEYFNTEEEALNFINSIDFA